MKVVTVVGARPQFIKAAAVSRKLRKCNTELLVHTGQHYDANMSDIFFSELGIPKPDINLEVGSGSHAKQTAAIMIGLEGILLKERPDYLLIYGDTNSTLGAALAACKVHTAIIHVEAGLRSFNMEMPEEINRVLSDRVSKLLLCPTDTAVNNLKREGITNGVYNIGDVMCDAVRYYTSDMDIQDTSTYVSHLKALSGSLNGLSEWYLATIHRAENTNSMKKMVEIMDALNCLNKPVLFPAHPRTRGILQQLLSHDNYKNIIITEPLGYLDMLYFTKHAIKVITDSGGLQKEAYMLDSPCITIREQTEWVETLEGNFNVLAHADKEDILNKITTTKIDYGRKQNYYGTGFAADHLCKIIMEAAK